MQSHDTFAARAGRWSAKNRKKAIWGWLAFVVIAFVAGNMLGVKKPANQNEYVGQSGRGDKLVDQHFPKQGAENVLIQARRGGHATDAAVRSAVDDVVAAVGGRPRVADVKSPFAPATRARSPRTDAPSWSPSTSRATTRRARARSTRSRPP